MKKQSKEQLKKKRKVYRATVIAFVAVIAVLTVFAFIQLFTGPGTNDIGNIILLAALAIFSIATLAGMIVMPAALSKWGIYALHFGLLLFLAGQLAYFVSGELVNVSMQPSQVAHSRIQTEDGEVLELGFSIKLTSFDVIKYDPVYDVYKTSDGSLVYSDVESDREGYFDFGKYGDRIHADDLKRGGQMIEAVDLGSGYTARVRMDVKRYDAHITYTLDGKIESKILQVNKPLRVNGWKILLMSYDPIGGSATMAFKMDRGEFFSTSGLVVMIVGVFYVCIIRGFIEKRKKPSEAAETDTGTRSSRKKQAAKNNAAKNMTRNERKKLASKNDKTASGSDEDGGEGEGGDLGDIS